jgi:hypothetical protein
LSDPVDLLTLADAKLAIGNNAGTANDVLLASAITGVSQFLDELCGPIVQREIDAEKHDGGRCDVIVDYYPIASVSTATEYRRTTAVTLTEETPGVLPADGFIVEPLEGRLIRRRSGRDYHFADGRKNVVVTYVAGRYVDTGHVAERFKRAAGITLANYWRREHGGGQGAIGIVGITFGLPDAAKKWIEKDIHGVMA